MTVKVYGASDDLIELDGDISEEFSTSYGEKDTLVFSNGVILGVEYDDEGVWRITPKGGSDLVTVKTCEGEDGYSDIATVEGDVLWVAQVKAFAARKR